MSPEVTGNLAAEPSAHHVHILIVGSGFAGLGAAIRLSQRGETDFVVLERGSEVGGTWRDNTYPGAACDVPSHLYSYSFALNPAWTRSFSRQPEIQELPASPSPTRYDVRDKHRSARGHRRAVERRASGVAGRYRPGRLHRRRPRRRGRRAVRARAARHPRDRGLRRRGVPLRALGPRRRPERQAGRGHRHRRIGDPDRARRSPAGRAPRRLPAHGAVGDAPPRPRLHHAGTPRVQARPGRAARSPALAIYCGREAQVVGLRQGTDRMQPLERMARAETSPRDRRPGPAPQGHPGLADRLQAHADLQRLVPDARRARTSTWSPTASPRSVRTPIVTRDGTVREVDAIVVATGFHVTDSPTFERIIGRDGRRSRDLATSRASRPTRARRSRASRTCCSSSAPTPASGTPRWST